MWTRDELQRLIQSEFRGVRIIAVSNREPYIHRDQQGVVECMQPAGGVAAALDPIMQASGGTWIAHGCGNADRIAVDGRDHVLVPPHAPAYTLRRVWLDGELEDRYYYGLANEGLWPLCHNAYQRPNFRLEDWQGYRRANRIFARAVLEEAAGRPAVVFIQDYHLGLLPRMIKAANPNLVVAQFWHIPWPNREIFGVFPWREELLDGLLGNDLLGFHLRSHSANFLDTVDHGREALVDNQHCRVTRGDHTTEVRDFPISIDFAQHSALAASEGVRRERERWREQIGDCELVGIGIDRLDYTKGIPDRLQAIDAFLEQHPEYRRRLVFVQIAVPSREKIEQYRALNAELEHLVERINSRWGDAGWRPILLHRRNYSQPELIGLHQLAHFCLVSSLHDGMNLVAKEYAGSRIDGDGVLILSRFAGAAHELTDALLVNPFCRDEMASAIHRALTMRESERRRRMRRLCRVVRENNVYGWGAGILGRLLSFQSVRAERVAQAGAGAWGAAEAASRF